MNILFLSMAPVGNSEKRLIFDDMYEKFESEGHEVYVVAPIEKKENTKGLQYKKGKINVLEVNCGNLTVNVNKFEKGIAMITLQNKFKATIKKYLEYVVFDMVIYTTPPITFNSVIKYIKRRDNAKTYLLLKDVFPQNAVDLGMMNKDSVIYKYFRNTEKELYANSDYIGCMTKKNIEFLLKNNKNIKKNIVEIAPNAIEIKKIRAINKSYVRKKYDLPQNAILFIYGGNLGMPQGIDFICRCMNENKNREDRHFIFCGKGTEYDNLRNFVRENNIRNITIINQLNKKNFDDLIQSSDVGMIFLDNRFTIPNFPAKLLSYMEFSLPIIAATDPNTDVKDIIEEAKMGWWCESTNEKKYTEIIDSIVLSKKLKKIGENSRECLEKNYTVDKLYKTISDHFYE